MSNGMHRVVHTTKHGEGHYVATQLDVSEKTNTHAVLTTSDAIGWAYLNRDELEDLIGNLQDLLEVLE